jgi:hypothetical protein
MSDRTEDLIAEGADMALRLGPLADSGFGARVVGQGSAPRRCLATGSARSPMFPGFGLQRWPCVATLQAPLP